MAGVIGASVKHRSFTAAVTDAVIRQIYALEDSLDAASVPHGKRQQRLEFEILEAVVLPIG
jgi:hypothetical protein